MPEDTQEQHVDQEREVAEAAKQSLGSLVNEFAIETSQEEAQNLTEEELTKQTNRMVGWVFREGLESMLYDPTDIYRMTGEKQPKIHPAVNEFKHYLGTLKQRPEVADKFIAEINSRLANNRSEGSANRWSGKRYMEEFWKGSDANVVRSMHEARMNVNSDIGEDKSFPIISDSSPSYLP